MTILPIGFPLRICRFLFRGGRNARRVPRIRRFPPAMRLEFVDTMRAVLKDEAEIADDLAAAQCGMAAAAFFW